jgi:hypothetical protein
MASSLFSTIKASCIVFIFDVTNNFCTHGRFELVKASVTTCSDTVGCSAVPAVHNSKDVKPHCRLHTYHTYSDKSVPLCVTAIFYSNVDGKTLF